MATESFTRGIVLDAEASKKFLRMYDSPPSVKRSKAPVIPVLEGDALKAFVRGLVRKSK